MIDYGLLLDIDLVKRIRAYPAKSREFISAKNEIYLRYFEEIKKAVHVFCMPSPEDEAVARDLFRDIEKVLMGFKKGMSLCAYLSSYARKNIALPRWKQKPSFYMAAYSGGILTLTGLIIFLILTGSPSITGVSAKPGTLFDGRRTRVLQLDRSSAITLGRDAVIGAVSGISGGKITAEFSLVTGDVECKLRKLSADEYFRLDNAVASVEVRGTDFKAEYEKGLFRVDVIEGRVFFTDKIKGTNFIIAAPGNYETGAEGYLKKTAAAITEKTTNESDTGAESLRGPRNLLKTDD
ncbi:MAG: FecR family protein [Brevinematales bacterium]